VRKALNADTFFPRLYDFQVQWGFAEARDDEILLGQILLVT